MAATGDIHALVPLTLKRQAFSVMALRGIKFSPWVREQLKRFVAEQQAIELRTQEEVETNLEGVSV